MVLQWCNMFLAFMKDSVREFESCFFVSAEHIAAPLINIYLQDTPHRYLDFPSRRLSDILLLPVQVD